MAKICLVSSLFGFLFLQLHVFERHVYLTLSFQIRQQSKERDHVEVVMFAHFLSICQLVSRGVIAFTRLQKLALFWKRIDD